MGRHIIIEDGTHKRESKKYGKLGKQISEYSFPEKLLDIGLIERELGWVEKSLDIEGYDIDSTYYTARVNVVSKVSVIKQFLSKSIREIPTFNFPLNREFISFFWESVDWEKAWQYFEKHLRATYIRFQENAKNNQLRFVFFLGACHNCPEPDFKNRNWENIQSKYVVFNQQQQQ
tara:strand:- start:569 stop:1093 length:525 start_codon:yes stop_codon:yes gene_type:complete